MKKAVLFLLIIGCVSNVFTQTEEEVVSLPFEILLNRNEKLIIRENGIIEFGGNFFVYKENGEKYPIKYEALITTYIKNNLYGINILEETEYGGYIDHTIVIDIKTKQEVPYEKDEYFRFWDFISMQNCFVLVSAEKAYAYDDITGELMWTQIYRQKDGRRIIVNDDHFIIDDVDGNRYKIFKNGEKVKI
jgi:hypothetical protein